MTDFKMDAEWAASIVYGPKRTGNQMAETFEEQLCRVRQMADGLPTWDLSDSDTAALTAVLGWLDDLRATCRMVLAGLEAGRHPVFSFDAERERLESVLAVAEE